MFCEIKSPVTLAGLKLTIAKADLVFLISLILPLEFWDYRVFNSANSECYALDKHFPELYP